MLTPPNTPDAPHLADQLRTALPLRSPASTHTLGLTVPVATFYAFNLT